MPTSADDTSKIDPRDLAVIQSMTGGKTTGPGATAMRGAMRAHGALSSFGQNVIKPAANLLLPQTATDWAIFLATMPLEDSGALLKFLGRSEKIAPYFNKARKISEPITRQAERFKTAEPEAEEFLPELESKVRGELNYAEDRALQPIATTGPESHVPATISQELGPVHAEIIDETHTIEDGPRGKPWLLGPETPASTELPPSPFGQRAANEAAKHARHPLRPGLLNFVRSRWALPLRGAIGGAIGAKVSGEDTAGGGAERGFGVGATAGILSKGYELGARRFAEQSVINSGIRSFGKALAARIPGFSKIVTPEDVDREFVGGNAAERLAGRMRGVQGEIAREVKGQLFSVPLPDGRRLRVPFRVALEYIRQFEDRGFSSTSGGPRGTISGREWRKLVGRTIDSIAEQLNTVDGGLGDYWARVRKDYGAARTLTQLFRKEDVMGGHRGINWPKVQTLLRQSPYIESLQTMLGREGADDITFAARRGYTAKTDIPSRRSHLTAHAGITPGGVDVIPRAHFGRTYQPSGKLPGRLSPHGSIFVPSVERETR
jgi:hypothetical protein